MCRAIVPLLVIAATACASTPALSVVVNDSDYQAVTAGAVGCPRDEIAISDQKNTFKMGDAPPTWRATCRGHTFICSGTGETVSCKEELQPLPAAAQPAP